MIKKGIESDFNTFSTLQMVIFSLFNIFLIIFDTYIPLIAFVIQKKKNFNPINRNRSRNRSF